MPDWLIVNSEDLGSIPVWLDNLYQGSRIISRFLSKFEGKLHDYVAKFVIIFVTFEILNVILTHDRCEHC